MPREKSTGPTSDFRKQQLAVAARAIIEQHGMDHVYNGGKLRPMADIMMKQTGCSVDTAKRHLAKQLRVMRGEIVASRGGAREGAGRPPKENKMKYEMKNLEGHNVATITYEDGTMFTPIDWQGQQPTEDEIESTTWFKVDPNHPGDTDKWTPAIMLQGGPRTIE